MTSLLIFWVSTAIVFLIIEMFTTTFYGLALAISAGIVALYVWLTRSQDLDIIQGLIFALISALTSFVLPKWLTSSFPDVSQGVDRYTGTKRSVKKVGGDLKISLDGVDYLIESEDALLPGDKVEVIGHAGAAMKVKKAHA